MPENYGSILRKAREDAGLSIDEVSVKLAALGYKVSPKTLYGYENDVSSPKISLFMTMCNLYNVTDVYTTFHMREVPEPPSIILSPREKEIIREYRKMSAPEKKRFEMMLGLTPEPDAQPKQA